MTRDSPGAGGALDSSELRDLSTTPTTVRSAGITIIHPQLRDLLLPLERGRVLYPHGTDVEEQRWTDADSEGGFGDCDTQPQSQVRTLHELKFTPTCLTSNGSILACGGQKGELFLCDLPQTGKLRLAEPVQPFTLELRLPSRMINNAISILPAWPRGWLERRAEWKRAYAGYAHGPLVDEFEQSDSDRGADDNDDDDDDGNEDDNDEYMDYLEEGDDDDGDDEAMQSPASSVATYPNTIAFGTRRMSRTGGGGSGAGQSAWNRSYPQRPQYVSSHGTANRDGFVGRRGESGRRSPASSTTSSRRNKLHKDEPRILVSNNDKTVKMFSLRRLMYPQEREPERHRDPRERERSAATARADAQRERDVYVDMMMHGDSGNVDDWAPALSALRRTVDRPGTGVHGDPRYHRLIEAMAGAPSLEPARRAPLPPARPLFGSSFGYDGIGLNEGILAQDLRPPPTPPLPPDAVPRRPQAHPVRSSEDIQLRDTRYLGESMSSYRARNPGAQDASDARSRRDRQTRHLRAAELERRIGLAEGSSHNDADACKLSAVGGTRFKLAVNHSSLSPDLRTMVTVGDSTDVYLHEVVDGGQHFRRIGVYNAATDCGFSTSWSKDGRKFAVASQDGQVTVWDHRSSRPLAIFHTQPQNPGNHHLRQDYTEQHRSMDLPIGSQSGLEAARVVKFSPEGSDRDLLVFSEELSRIHIVDARTFQTHIYLEVPYNAPGVPPSPSRLPRRGIEGGMYGISGVAFDPTGDWLYASTERTVVEWDMRRYGGGEGGTWSMA